MPWYEDDGFWADFSEVMFSDARRARTAEVVATSPLFGFPAGTRVLDMCCGPGLFAVPLARRGCAVTGVDLSPVMLEQARAACAAADVDVRLLRGDMLTHVEPGSYEVVLNVFTSFGYFDTPEDNLRVLRNAHASLVPGGQLLLDLMGKEVLAGWIGRPQVVELDDAYVVQRDTILDDWTRLRTDWTLIRDGTAREASITSFLYSAAELRALVEAAGFTSVECHGDFDKTPYDHRARRLVVRATRPVDPAEATEPAETVEPGETVEPAETVGLRQAAGPAQTGSRPGGRR